VRAVVVGLHKRVEEVLGRCVVEFGEDIARGRRCLGEVQEAFAAAMDGPALRRG
jgi:hypothetical protein